MLPLIIILAVAFHFRHGSGALSSRAVPFTVGLLPLACRVGGTPVPFPCGHLSFVWTRHGEGDGGFFFEKISFSVMHMARTLIADLSGKRISEKKNLAENLKHYMVFFFCFSSSSYSPAPFGLGPPTKKVLETLFLKVRRHDERW